MSLSGSMSMSTLQGGKSVMDLPNLPGLRRSAASSNPRLFKDYLVKSNASLLEGSQRSEVFSQLGDAEYMSAISANLNPYPAQGKNYNDISGRYSIHSQLVDRKANVRSMPFSNEDSTPFIHEKDNCCVFSAYTWDDVPENLHELKRVRLVDIILNTHSNTIEICEPVIPNSGLMQGKLLRKHQVKKPNSDEYFTITDFYSGAVLEIYGREYTITNCSPHTRRYLQENLDINFGVPTQLPAVSDQRQIRASMEKSQSVESFSQVARPFTQQSKSFYEKDKQVLRFYGFWVGNEKPEPLRYHVRIHYYLTDDTIEIISEYTRNDGRDRTPKFLRKMRILKPTDTDSVEDGGAAMVHSTMEPQITDPNLYYHWTDFSIGGKLNVVGNDILIYDADRFTRDHYMYNSDALGERIETEVPAAPAKVVPPPPHNGFGSEEDSLQTCSGSLMPKAPKKDGLKAQLYAGVTLRFRVKFTKPRPADASREFILQLFLEDDTMQIREIPIRNSGFGGGMFLSRCKQYHKDDGRQILPADVTVGSKIRIQSFEFDVLDADEFSLKYMECNSQIWSGCSSESIAQKLKEKENDLRNILLVLKERALEEAPYDEITELLESVGLNLSKQEKITLFRLMDKHKKGTARFFRLFKLLNDEDTFKSWGTTSSSFASLRPNSQE